MKKKILLISLFHPELVRGGAQQACYELFTGLKEDGEYDPYLLASVEPHQYPSLFKSGAHITGFDGRENEFLFLSRAYDHLWHKCLEPASLERFQDFLLWVKPDVIHFHHFLTYGLDFISLARQVLPDVKIVFTLHEFLSICDSYGQMVRQYDRSMCDTPSSIRCHQCYPDRSPEHYTVKRMWVLRHFEAVDTFTTPTNFMIDFFVRFGLPAEKIVQISNGQKNLNQGMVSTKKATHNKFGFFGQLIDNKGLLVIFDAVEELRKRKITDFVVEINGANLHYATEGFREKYNAFMEKEAKLEDGANVIFNGEYEHKDFPLRINRVDWLIVPSIWWEIFGLIISEAWMFGKPVICSDKGGPGERIRHDVDGLQFRLGDGQSLADAMERAITEEGLWERLHGNVEFSCELNKVVGLYKQLAYSKETAN